MKFALTSLLVALAAASPIAVPELQLSADTISGDIEARQSGSSTRNELERGSASACPRAILVFARGSTESGNLGSLGVPLGNALEARYGAAQVWVQGVGGPYNAGLNGNFAPRGSTPAAIAEAVRLFNLAASRCPNAAIVSGGYSQGAALIAAALTDTAPAVRNRVVGTVLFGYTKNQQNRGGVPGYPASNLRVYCASGDLVCAGTLTIRPPHFSYGDEAADEAPAFLISRIGA